MRDPGGQGGGANHVGGLAFVDLLWLVDAFQRLTDTNIAEADILNQRGVNLGLGQGLLEQSVHHVVQLGVLETALASLGQGSAQGQSDNDIIGVLLGAVIDGQPRVQRVASRRSYMALSPLLEPGLRWLKIELRRSAAIMRGMLRSDVVSTVIHCNCSSFVSRLGIFGD